MVDQLELDPADEGLVSFRENRTLAERIRLPGVLQAQVGWQIVNMAALPLMAVVFLAAVALARHQAREAAAAGSG